MRDAIVFRYGQGIFFGVRFVFTERAPLFYPFSETRKDLFAMKKTILSTTAVILVVLSLFCFVGCEDRTDATGLWENATYTSDVTLGEGAKVVTFDVEAGDKKITVTLKTDKETLGEAMFEQGLINDPSFFDTLNGIVASWSNDKAYWAFYPGETMAPYGVNDQQINGGESFRFVYTR